MKRFLLSTFWLWILLPYLSIGQANSCGTLPAFTIPSTAGQPLSADAVCQDADGWLHYYDASNGQIILSIFPNGQQVGDFSSGLQITGGTLPGWGSGGYDLSAADYIDQDIWGVTHRFWQIENAPAISDSVLVRWYFDMTDVSDVNTITTPYGVTLDGPEDLLMFTVRGPGLNPYSLALQPVGGLFTLYDQVPGMGGPDWINGVWNGLVYAEIGLTQLNAGGGAGAFIVLPNVDINLSGNLKNQWNEPIDNASIFCNTEEFFSNSDGAFSCTDLPQGEDYIIRPQLSADARANLSVLDLLALDNHLAGAAFVDPLLWVAGDGTRDFQLDASDVDLFQDLILYRRTTFPNNMPWRFTPKSYVFPPVPLSVPYPEQRAENNVLIDRNGLDFWGVKVGNLAKESQFPTTTNTENPTFYLEELSTCATSDTIDMWLRVQDFRSVKGFQFTLQWDPSQLSLVGTMPFQLLDFEDQDVQLFAADGRLSVAWHRLEGATMGNDDKILLLRWINNATVGITTPIVFGGFPTEIQVLRSDWSTANPVLTSGAVRVISTGLQYSISDVISNVCPGDQIGGMKLNVSGGSAPYRYQWSNGVTQPHLANVAAGIYGVTVSDNSDCPLILNNLIVPGPEDFSLEGLDVLDVLCFGLSDGLISFVMAGGTPGYQYNWSNGAQGTMLDNLSGGVYAFTVTDANNCTSDYSFDVAEAGITYLNVDIQSPTNPSASNGNIIVRDVFGGVAPYQFQWSNGRSTRNLTNVPLGNYFVTVTDANNCSYTYAYVVQFTTDTEDLVISDELSVFPNPQQTNAYVHLVVEAGDSAPSHAFWVDMMGRKSIAEMERTSNGLMIQTPSVFGLYHLICESKTEKYSTTRIVILP